MTRIEAYGQGLHVGDKIKVNGLVLHIHCMYDKHTIVVLPKVGKFRLIAGRMYPC